MPGKEALNGILMRRLEAGVGGIKEVQAVLPSGSSGNDFAEIATSAFGRKVFSVDIELVNNGIDRSDLFFAEELGLTILPLSYVKLEGDGVVGWMGPTLVPKEHPLAHAENMVLYLGEEGRSADPSYYVRMTVKDNAGVLSKVAQSFAKTNINIKAMRQPKAEPGTDQTEMAFLLNPCNLDDLDRTLADIENLDEVVGINSLFRVVLPAEKIQEE